MNNENQPTLWDKAKAFENRPFLPKLENGQEYLLTFEGDGNEKKGKFGPELIFNVTNHADNQKYAFSVKQTSILGQLKPYRPLDGKTFRISRKGSTMTDTKFTVRLQRPEREEIETNEVPLVNRMN